MRTLIDVREEENTSVVCRVHLDNQDLANNCGDVLIKEREREEWDWSGRGR